METCCGIMKELSQLHQCKPRRKDLQSVRLGDFGISKNLRSTASLCQTVVGTQAVLLVLHSPLLTLQERSLHFDLHVWNIPCRAQALLLL